ncbi:MAG: hypothetical protein WCQ44_12985, partial [Opitutaceae bacterium]
MENFVPLVYRKQFLLKIMTKHFNQIDQLLEKLDILQKNHDSVSREMYRLRKEIYRMKTAESQQELETEAENVPDEIRAEEKRTENEREFATPA